MNETWLKLIPWNGTFEEAIQEAADRKEELDEGEAFYLPPILLAVSQKTRGKVIIPPIVSILGKRCFEGCCWIREIKGMQHVRSIWSSAFHQCVELRKIDTHKIEWPLHVKSRAFSALWAMKELYLPDGTRDLPCDVFEGSHFKEVSLPSGIRFPRLLGCNFTIRKGIEV